MSKKPIKKTSDKTRNLKLYGESGKTVDAVMAEVAMSPLAANASTAVDYSKGLFPGLSLNDCVEVLKGQVQSVNTGNLGVAEATLTAQAVTLDAIFNTLAKRAIHAEYLDNLDRYLRLALKAQNQCRATLETLAAIKNPPTIYARQANVTTGPQQINNGTATPSRTRENESAQTKLSGDGHELLPDTRTSALASRIGSQMETLEEFDRAEIRSG